DVLFRDDLGVDGDRLDLLGAVDADGDHAAAGVALDAEAGHLLLQALLHLLRLLHHLLDVHISSTSRISAGKTSSIVCTPASASACSRNADFLSVTVVADPSSTSFSGVAASTWTAATTIVWPASRWAMDSSQLRS